MQLDFDSTRHRPWQGDLTPVAYAMRMWADLDFETLSVVDACAMAPVDASVYDALWNAVEAGLPDHVTLEQQALILHALVRKRPHKSSMARRNAKLCAVGAALARQYPLKPNRRRGSNHDSISSILAKLMGAPSELQIEDIIRGNVRARIA